MQKPFTLIKVGQHITKFQVPELSGITVTPTAEVRTTAMLVL
jgi:hypothetical protein